MRWGMTRAVAWSIAAGAVVAVMIGYESLPDTLPTSRWTTAPKSPFVALRVPLINLLTMGLVELLSRGLLRTRQFNLAAAVAVLLATTAAKALIEAIGILTLPKSPSWTTPVLAVVIGGGIATAAYLSRSFLSPGRWKDLQLTPMESAGALAVVLGIVALSLPLVWR